ncbi:MAG TPA: hypothetical protein VKQ36_04335 [Ktedonobacterales bacterium]|nr:hypothetical protein [Ktedonobacterales bacterium]
MAYQITLTDDDYAALEAVATQRGEPIEALLHQAIVSKYPATSPARQQQGTYTYPTHKPIDPALKAEMEQLATQIGSEKPWASEMIIEDRGPR